MADEILCKKILAILAGRACRVLILPVDTLKKRAKGT